MTPAAPLTAAEFKRLLDGLRQALLLPGCPEPGPEAEAPDGVDWQRFVQAARRHGVAPVLGRPPAGAPPAGLPASAQEALHEVHRANAHRVRLLGTELVAVVVRLRVSGVSALPFKGPLLAARFYPEPASRSCGNLELLIQPTDLQAAGEALAREGYRFVPLTGTMGEVAQWHVEGNARFRHPGRGVEVCLCAQLVPRRYGYRLDFDRLWQRARVEESLPAGRLTSLSPEDWILLLCLDTIKNGFWPRLKPACDLARVIAGSAELDWRYVREESRRLGVERVVLLALALTDELLGVGLPPDWREAIANDAVVGKLAARVRGRLARCETGFTSLLEANRTHAALRRHPLEKFRFAMAVMTTPSARDFEFLGRPVSVPGSYAVRGVKLAGKCVGQTLGRLVPSGPRSRGVVTAACWF